MVEAKGTKDKGTPAKKKGVRGRQPMSNKVPIVAAAVLLVAVAVVVVLMLSKKPASGGTAGRTATKDAPRRATKSGAAAAARPAASPAPSAAARSPASAARHPRVPPPAPAPRERPVREPRVATASPRSSKSSNAAGRHSTVPRIQELTAISEGSALIGNRTAREGDVIKGCLIQEIATDRVTVVFQGASYTLHIGDQLP